MQLAPATHDIPNVIKALPYLALPLSLALGIALQAATPVAAQQVKAGVLTCDVSAGIGLILGSQKLVSCSFSPDGEGRREDYDGSITKFGLDLGLTRSSRMVWVVFTNTVAGPGFLAGDYFGASGKATVGAGVELMCYSVDPIAPLPYSPYH